MSEKNKFYLTDNQIQDIIKEFELLNNITILFAVESGSRMWGFESDDSDYDIRVVFTYPTVKYLGIRPYKETIDYMIKDPDTDKPILDVSGWELKFFTKHMIKSNPSVYEWFMSPIVYFKRDDINNYRKVFMDHLNKISLAYHYRGIVFKNYNKFVKDKPEVKCKKYIYILRAIACFYALTYQCELPEMDYRKVLKYLPTLKLQEKMKELVAQKQKSESTLTEPIPEINEACLSVMDTVSQREIKLTSFPDDIIDLINFYVIETLEGKKTPEIETVSLNDTNSIFNSFTK